MKELINTLHSGNYSCVISTGNTIRTFSRRGIADLYDILNNEPSLLKNARIADKVIGKGAAALLIQGGVTQVYADLMSEPALALLKEAGIDVTYLKLVHHIENRDKTDWCPLEKRCTEVSTVKEILPIIDDFIAAIRSRQ